jgi:hypothetical protein
MDDGEKKDVPWDEGENVVRMIQVPPPARLVPVVPPLAEPPHEAETAEVTTEPPVYRDEDFDDKDDEPFDRPNAHKLGIIGGKGVGKTYLFQAMFYRCFAGEQAGALTRYLERDGAHLFIATGANNQFVKTGKARTLNRVNFIKKYENWERLASTTKVVQQWYRCRLLYRTGLLGRSRTAMDVEFLDASGEGLLELGSLSASDREVWERAYLDARVMVFCLPLWGAFPASTLTEEDWEIRQSLIVGLEQVVNHYKDMRRRNSRTDRVSTILALTMADDRRSALRALHDSWINPYLQSPYPILKQLRRETGVARYIANARRISEALHAEFASSRAPKIANIPGNLDFGGGEPWIVPMSAIHGERLDYLDNKYKDGIDDPARRMEVRDAAPTPVHVELPLLLALCERENALM